MASDDFEELAKIGDADSKAGMDARIERERRVQTRSRRIRKTCRWVILVGGLGGIGSIFLGMHYEAEALFGLACALFLPMIIASIVLFFMGGLAPMHVRGRLGRHLSDRERDLLDN